MDKKEFYGKVNEKIKMSKEEFEKLFVECEKEIKERGITQNVELSTLTLMQTKLKKTLSSPSKTFTGIILGKGGVFDNSKKQREEAKTMWKNNKEQAILEKYTDEEGNPLYRRGYADIIGRKIPESDMKCTVYMLAREETVENADKLFLKALSDGDKDIRETHLVMRGEKCYIETPVLKVVEFRANLGKNSTDILFELNQSTLTEFKVKSEEEIELPKIAMRYLKPYCVALKDLKEYHDKNQGNFNSFAIFKANVSDVIIGEVTPSNIIRIDDMALGMQNETITCWSPKDLQINFSEGAQGMFFVGRTGVNKY